MDKGVPLEEIDIPLKLSMIKPLHAKRLLEMYNHMTSAEGKKVCIKGWQVAGIKEAVDKGLARLTSLDPFEDIHRSNANESHR